MDEKNILKRQYKLFVTICVVVGFIVGTGIFWLPGRVLYYSGGDLWTGVLAWVIGGLVISTCVYMFSVLSAKYEKVHGMVDYAEVIVGKNYGYLAGWFFAIMYQTAGYAIIAWITSSFTATLAGHAQTRNTPFTIALTIFYMVAMFLLNYFAAKLPMKLNVFTTVARLIPLVLIGVAGLFFAIFTRDTSLAEVSLSGATEGLTNPSFLAAVVATVFAYNGWQAAVAFNSEVKDSKRTFPIALLLGFFTVMVIYVLYFIGVVTQGDPALLMENNQLGTRAAFANTFGGIASNVLLVFVITSGLGILNMCCMGMSRGLYSLARRDRGPVPEKMVQLHPKTNIPGFSMIVCVAVSFLWLIVIIGSYNGWYGQVDGRNFAFNLPDFYNMIFFVLLIPIFIMFIIRNHDDRSIHWFNRLVAPVLATAGAGFMIYARIAASPVHAAVYVITFIVLAAVGFALSGKEKKLATD